MALPAEAHPDAARGALQLIAACGTASPGEAGWASPLELLKESFTPYTPTVYDDTISAVSSRGASPASQNLPPAQDDGAAAVRGGGRTHDACDGDADAQGMFAEALALYGGGGMASDLDTLQNVISPTPPPLEAKQSRARVASASEAFTALNRCMDAAGGGDASRQVGGRGSGNSATLPSVQVMVADTDPPPAQAADGGAGASSPQAPPPRDEAEGGAEDVSPATSGSSHTHDAGRSPAGPSRHTGSAGPLPTNTDGHGTTLDVHSAPADPTPARDLSVPPQSPMARGAADAAGDGRSHNHPNCRREEEVQESYLVQQHAADEADAREAAAADRALDECSNPVSAASEINSPLTQTAAPPSQQHVTFNDSLNVSLSTMAPTMRASASTLLDAPPSRGGHDDTSPRLRSIPDDVHSLAVSGSSLGWTLTNNQTAKLAQLLQDVGSLSLSGGSKPLVHLFQSTSLNTSQSIGTVSPGARPVSVQNVTLPLAPQPRTRSEATTPTSPPQASISIAGSSQPHLLSTSNRGTAGTTLDGSHSLSASAAQSLSVSRSTLRGSGASDVPIAVSDIMTACDTAAPRRPTACGQQPGGTARAPTNVALPHPDRPPPKPPRVAVPTVRSDSRWTIYSDWTTGNTAGSPPRAASGTLTATDSTANLGHLGGMGSTSATVLLREWSRVSLTSTAERVVASPLRPPGSFPTAVSFPAGIPGAAEARAEAVSATAAEYATDVSAPTAGTDNAERPAGEGSDAEERAVGAGGSQGGTPVDALESLTRQDSQLRRGGARTGGTPPIPPRSVPGPEQARDDPGRVLEGDGSNSPLTVAVGEMQELLLPETTPLTEEALAAWDRHLAESDHRDSSQRHCSLLDGSAHETQVGPGTQVSSKCILPSPPTPGIASLDAGQADAVTLEDLQAALRRVTENLAGSALSAVDRSVLSGAAANVQRYIDGFASCAPGQLRADMSDLEALLAPVYARLEPAATNPPQSVAEKTEKSGDTKSDASKSTSLRGKVQAPTQLSPQTSHVSGRGERVLVAADASMGGGSGGGAGSLQWLMNVDELDMMSHSNSINNGMVSTPGRPPVSPPTLLCTSTGGGDRGSGPPGLPLPLSMSSSLQSGYDPLDQPPLSPSGKESSFLRKQARADTLMNSFIRSVSVRPDAPPTPSAAQRPPLTRSSSGVAVTPPFLRSVASGAPGGGGARGGAVSANPPSTPKASLMRPGHGTPQGEQAGNFSGQPLLSAHGAGAGGSPWGTPQGSPLSGQAAVRPTVYPVSPQQTVRRLSDTGHGVYDYIMRDDGTDYVPVLMPAPRVFKGTFKRAWVEQQQQREAAAAAAAAAASSAGGTAVTGEGRGGGEARGVRSALLDKPPRSPMRSRAAAPMRSRAATTITRGKHGGPPHPPLGVGVSAPANTSSVASAAGTGSTTGPTAPRTAARSAQWQPPGHTAAQDTAQPLQAGAASKTATMEKQTSTRPSDMTVAAAAAAPTPPADTRTRVRTVDACVGGDGHDLLDDSGERRRRERDEQSRDRSKSRGGRERRSRRRDTEKEASVAPRRPPYALRRTLSDVACPADTVGTWQAPAAPAPPLEPPQVAAARGRESRGSSGQGEGLAPHAPAVPVGAADACYRGAHGQWVRLEALGGAGPTPAPPGPPAFADAAAGAAAAQWPSQMRHAGDGAARGWMLVPPAPHAPTQPAGGIWYQPHAPTAGPAQDAAGHMVYMPVHPGMAHAVYAPTPPPQTYAEAVSAVLAPIPPQRMFSAHAAPAYAVDAAGHVVGPPSRAGMPADEAVQSVQGRHVAQPAEGGGQPWGPPDAWGDSVAAPQATAPGQALKPVARHAPHAAPPPSGAAGNAVCALGGGGARGGRPRQMALEMRSGWEKELAVLIQQTDQSCFDTRAFLRRFNL